jgi:hypothetical protein
MQDLWNGFCIQKHQRKSAKTARARTLAAPRRTFCLARSNRTPGIKYSGLYLGGDNTADFYEVNVAQGQHVHVEVNDTGYPEYGPAFCMYVYDPAGNVAVSAGNLESPLFGGNVDFSANATGEWYVELRKVADFGFYSIEVDIR